MIDLHAINLQTVSKFTGETKLGQGGAGALGSRDNLSIPCPSWACTGAPDQLQGLQLVVLLLPNFLQWVGPRARTPGVGETREKEKNGYPFTTFTDFSDFLGITLGVWSDDLATMLILY